jgi:hypothetical protein
MINNAHEIFHETPIETGLTTHHTYIVASAYKPQFTGYIRTPKLATTGKLAPPKENSSCG